MDGRTQAVVDTLTEWVAARAAAEYDGWQRELPTRDYPALIQLAASLGVAWMGLPEAQRDAIRGAWSMGREREASRREALERQVRGR